MTISPEPVRTTPPTEEAAAVAAARGGDRDAFAALCERYRRQLHVHCYRMLGSVDDADDLVQDTYLKAWQARASFEGRSLFRTWLYRIATNACLDALARRPKRVMPPDVRPAEQVLNTDFAPSVDLPWLQPYPDRLLELPAPVDDEPSVVVEARETIELAYLAAIQHLPARQRAVLILRDAMSWSARETAELLGISEAAANSLLQRARVTMRTKLPERRSEWTRAPEITDAEHELLRRYIAAAEAADATAFTCPLPRLHPGRRGAWCRGRRRAPAHAATPDVVGRKGLSVERRVMRNSPVPRTGSSFGCRSPRSVVQMTHSSVIGPVGIVDAGGQRATSL